MATERKKNSISRRSFLKTGAISAAALASAMVGIVKGSEMLDWVEISEWDIGVKYLPDSMAGIKMVHLTDIHVSDWMTAERLADIKEALLAMEFDLILVTGDLTYHTSDISSLKDFFQEFVDHMPVIMVLGNHDIWDGGKKTLQPLFDIGVRLLENDYFNLSASTEPFYIAGLGCVYESQDDLQRVLADMPSDGPALLMVHEPDVAPRCAAANRFFMQISGHSHGGQVCLPGGYAPILPWLGQKYPSGFYQVDGMMLYTCRGIGRSRPFMRINCPAEIAVYHLQPSDTAFFQIHENL